MLFNQILLQGKLIKRYKRFLADIELQNGEIITAHCPNSGSMKGCANPGWEVLLSTSENKKRKYKHTLEMIHNGKCWIGINTRYPNFIVEEAVRKNLIPELVYENIKPEVKTSEHSRLDLKLWNKEDECFVEIKNCTLVNKNYYEFPDSVTTRGYKHLEELLRLKNEGYRAVIFFLVQRNDASIFRAAQDIDPKYAAKLKEVYSKGVEILVYRAEVTPEKIEIVEKIPFELN